MVNILIADDFRGPKFLEAFPHENVRIAATVEQAIEAVRTTKFDVIFLDYDFEQPGLSGQDVASIITRSINKTTPVVVVTNLPQAGYRLLNFLTDHHVPAQYAQGESKGFLDAARTAVKQAAEKREEVAQ